MARVVQVYRGITKNPIGIQLGHAGRKASSHPPFAGGKPLGPDESPWRRSPLRRFPSARAGTRRTN